MARAAEIGRVEKLQRQLLWAQQIRADASQPTAALQLADAVIEMTEEALEVERLRLEQVDRFFGVTELGTPTP